MAVETMTTEPVGRPLGLSVPRLSWGAVFGGAVAALGLWILLYALGVALGLSTINPENPESAQASGIFTGVWSAVSPLVALFVGGIVAGRAAGITTRLDGAAHGLVMWGLTTLVGTFFVASTVAAVARGVVGAGTAVAQLGGEAVSQAPKALSINADEALGPVNARLQAQGLPPVTADQLQAAVGQVLQQGAATGQIDREALVNALAQQTDMTRADAQEVATRLQTQIEQAKSKLGEVKENVKQKALTGAEKTGKAFWGVFGALLLGLISAVLGASLGVTRRQRRIERTLVDRGPPREVYP